MKKLLNFIEWLRFMRILTARIFAYHADYGHEPSVEAFDEMYDQTLRERRR